MTASTTSTDPTTDHRASAMAAAPLLAVAVVVNLVILGIASLADAALTVDNAGTLMSVGIVEVTAASLLPLSLAIVAWVALAPRVALVRRAWTPAIIVVTLASLGGLLGASDLTTGVALGTMHLVVGSLAAFGLPARVSR